LTGSDSTARTWDADSGALVQALHGHIGSITTLAWSPDRRQLLTGSADATARVWEAGSGAPLQTLRGHTDRVTMVAWNPDGQQVLTASRDMTARRWVISSALLVAELTRRVCNSFAERDIGRLIPTWRGCSEELAAVADDLAAYTALQGAR
jgi:WD40 repeat protein